MPGWRVAVDRISAALQKRTVPESSQLTLNAILQDQRTAYRYDRQARNLIRLIGETHEDAKALFAATSGPHDPALDWTGIRERRQALQKVVDHLPPADEIDPYLAHYDARANSALGDTMVARLERNFRAAYRHQVEVPAAELFELTGEAVELRGHVRGTMREGGLPALYDDAHLHRLRETGRKLGQAVAAGSDAFDPELERNGVKFAAVEGLATDTLAAIATIDRRLDENVAGAARDLIRLRDEVQRLCGTAFPDEDVRAARHIVDLEHALSALEDRMNALPPVDRLDIDLGKLEADLSVASLRTDLRRFHAHLRLANRTFFGDAGRSQSERLAETIEQWRQENVALREKQRAQTSREDAAFTRQTAPDRQQAERQKEEERSASQEEDTGLSMS